jgi:hypothetical protein
MKADGLKAERLPVISFYQSFINAKWVWKLRLNQSQFNNDQVG